MSDSTRPSEDIVGRGMSRGLILLFAVATGQAVASNYLAQPLLETLRDQFGVTAAVAGLIVTASQVGYAAGLILLLPLGDLFERRRLITTLAAITVAGLVAAAVAPSIGFFIAAAGVIGMTSVMAQLLVPFAATLAPEAERGRVVGKVMSGLILGILLARTFSGLVSQIAGWRAVYAIAAVLMLVQTVVLYVKLPRYRSSAGLSYPKLLASVLELARGEPVLRRRALYGVFSFAAFSVLWTTLAFLLAGPHYGYSDGIIGLFGLVGAAGALTASVVGRFTDRGWVYWLTGGSLGLMLAGFVFLCLRRPVAGGADRRHRASGHRLPGCPHQQPERDLPAAAGGAEPHQRLLYDDLFRRCGRRLRRVRVRLRSLGLGRYLRARLRRLHPGRRPLGDRPAAASRRAGARPRGTASRMTRKDQI